MGRLKSFNVTVDVDTIDVGSNRYYAAEFISNKVNEGINNFIFNKNVKILGTLRVITIEKKEVCIIRYIFQIIYEDMNDEFEECIFEDYIFKKVIENLEGDKTMKDICNMCDCKSYTEGKGISGTCSLCKYSAGLGDMDMYKKEECDKKDIYDNVNHPAHYCQEGSMECIDEMVLIFGIEETMHFCKLNAWKYRKRAMYKNGEEDLKKSDWYLNKYKELSESWRDE